MRIGQSWDIHRLVNDRELIIGGVNIPYEKGLLGHSDADVLSHVIAEAMLGALALGDLGTHFPDNDKKYKDMSSISILKKVYKMILNKGFVISNIDSTIFAESPHLNKYILDMRKIISDVVETNIDNVSIKATTYEKLDAIGKGEAIAASAIVLLKESS